MSNQNWQLNEGDPFAPAAPDTLEHLPSHHCAASLSDTEHPEQHAKPDAPDCGACPGDGSVCKTSCRVAEESPPVTPDMKARQIANAVKPRMVGGFIAAPDIQACYAAADHIEAQQQRIEALERRLAEAKDDLTDADRDIEIQIRWKMEAQKKAALYEHVRTLNPMEFGRLWGANIEGKGPFDDLVLADMEKRKKERA